MLDRLIIKFIHKIALALASLAKPSPAFPTEVNALPTKYCAVLQTFIACLSAVSSVAKSLIAPRANIPSAVIHLALPTVFRTRSTEPLWFIGVNSAFLVVPIKSPRVSQLFSREHQLFKPLIDTNQLLLNSRDNPVKLFLIFWVHKTS